MTIAIHERKMEIGKYCCIVVYGRNYRKTGRLEL